MSDEKRTCKTCVHFNEDAYFCRARDCSQAEWDTCRDHITHDEFDAKRQTTGGTEA